MDDEGVTADRQVVTGAVWEPSVVAFFFCCRSAIYDHYKSVRDVEYWLS